ncbi:metal-dependent hydrolase [Kineosporia sp. NBRC 101731]|uniref:metal-dependent hydrolase n=1 Tax=Kineosporia sp. NBRC 101731 TaxID=3032199 RepID=UPI0024A21C96|nr:metal-dependent hydrolase [Kineosporia sp. NBRC 101731]GLY32085.1 hypothetical protein Kisp02_54500 [Kineosporia sp. NBRC 101731]
MLTKSHAPSGTLAGQLAALTLAPLDPRPSVVLALVAGATAGALLPDTDHHSSSPARMWGPVTQVPCAWIGRAAGGHREWTHDVSRGAPIGFAGAFLLCLVAPLLAGAAGAWHWLDVLSDGLGAVAIALVTGLALIGVDAWCACMQDVRPPRWLCRLLRVRYSSFRWPRIDAGTNAALSWLTALAVVGTYPGGLPVTVIAAIVGGVLIGVPAGIAGDACTLSGVPWRGQDRHLLPYGWRIRTGSDVETKVRVPILIAVTLLAWVLIGHPGTELLTQLPDAQASR